MELKSSFINCQINLHDTSFFILLYEKLLLVIFFILKSIFGFILLLLIFNRIIWNKIVGFDMNWFWKYMLSFVQPTWTAVMPWHYYTNSGTLVNTASSGRGVRHARQHPVAGPCSLFPTFSLIQSHHSFLSYFISLLSIIWKIIFFLLIK